MSNAGGPDSQLIEAACARTCVRSNLSASFVCSNLSEDIWKILHLAHNNEAFTTDMGDRGTLLQPACVYRTGFT